MFKESLILIALVITTAPASAEPIAPAEIIVWDGDTIRVHDRAPNVRLTGYNAPETWHPACPAEQQLGTKATERLRELVQRGRLDFEYVGRIGIGACAWGRDCGKLKADGRDVGAILIAEKLAVPFLCPGGHCPPTPRPWCP